MGSRQRSDLRWGHVAVAGIVLLLTVWLFGIFVERRSDRPSIAPTPTPTATGTVDPTPVDGGTKPGAAPTPTTAATVSPTASGDPFTQVDDDLNQLVDEQATWQAPASLTVRRSQRIGLVIGESQPLARQIEDLLEDAEPLPAGPVKVGPKVRVALWADPWDAVVKPSEAVDQSTGSQIALLWTWFVRPLHPSDAMSLTAHVEVLLNDHIFSTDVPLDLPVRRTVGYTFQQVFTHWTTLSAMAVALASGLGWLWKRRRNKQGHAQTAGPPDKVDDDHSPGRGDGTPQRAGTG